MLSVMIALLLATTAFAQSYATGPQVLTFHSDADDSDQPYALYLPPSFDPSASYPLIVSLHGPWSNHRLSMRQLFGRTHVPGTKEQPLDEVDFIVAAPFARGTMGYQGIAEKDVYDMVADVEKRFRIDQDRVYLTGVSMGGGGALWLALTRPDCWAAVAVVCPMVPPGTEELAPNALNLPIEFFHGEQDPIVPPTVSRRWQKMLLNLNADVEYIEYPEVRHNAWELAYRNGAIFPWFGKYRRDRYPDHVRFTTRAYKYSSAYWARLDGLTPGQPASLDARFTGSNHLEVQTSGVDGFTLSLAGHPRFTPGAPLELSVDGTRHRLRVRQSISLVKAGGAWRAGRYTPAQGAKRPGLEGPIAEAVASRHVYVYGTLNPVGEAELDRRRDEAAQAADWTTSKLKLLTSFQVLSDQQVSERDLASTNLVLFGTRATNHLIAQLAPRLPLTLNPGAADYGLIFVAPIDGHYVLVNSGLPWWTGAEQADRWPLKMLRGSPYSILPSFGDYILFKGSLANVVAEGRFDRDWKLPPVDARKMRATGAVEIR